MTPSTLFFSVLRRLPRPTLFPYTTLFRSGAAQHGRRDRRSSARAGLGTAARPLARRRGTEPRRAARPRRRLCARLPPPRSEEHTSELQSHVNLVCRLLLEKKKILYTDRL